MSGPLSGLRVVDLSNKLTSATVSGFLADFGADVVHVEPPGGSPLRTQPAYPFWGRGKQSIVLDFHDAADLRVARGNSRSAPTSSSRRSAPVSSSASASGPTSCAPRTPHWSTRR